MVDDAPTLTLRHYRSTLKRVAELYDLADFDEAASAEAVVRRLRSIGRRKEADELAALTGLLPGPAS